jgi:hypothetical protein
MHEVSSPRFVNLNTTQLVVSSFVQRFRRAAVCFRTAQAVGWGSSAEGNDESKAQEVQYGGYRLAGRDAETFLFLSIA